MDTFSIAPVTVQNGHSDASDLVSLITRIATSVPGKPDDEAIREIVRDEVLQIAPREVRVKVGNRPTITFDKATHTHSSLSDALLLLANLHKLALIGPTGSGKTVLAEQAAKALGQRFAYQSCSGGVTESAFLGRAMPSGYQGTQFVDYFENGGVFLFDEVDASDPNVLLIVNSALSNGYLSVPSRTDKPTATRHDDFYVVLCANTYGTGADRMYVGRNQLDEAFLDRFRIAQIELGYDTALEDALVPEQSLRNAYRRIRQKVADNKLRRSVSMRSLLDAYTMRRAGWSLQQAIAALVTGWTPEEKSKVGIIL